MSKSQNSIPLAPISKLGRKRHCVSDAYERDTCVWKRNAISTPISNRGERVTTINAEVTKKLLQKVSNQNPQYDKIYILADNAKYNKCKDVQAFLATQNKIQMIYLPPYSPNLNLIERVWKFMYEKVIHLTYFDTFSKFKKSITTFFDDFGEYQDELKSRITFNFQTFDDAIIVKP